MSFVDGYLMKYREMEAGFYTFEGQRSMILTLPLNSC